MKNKFYITVISVTLSCHTQAHIPSLFYTQKEQQAVHVTRQNSKSPSSLSVMPTNHFHLSGLLYSDPDNWKIWINTKPYDKKNFPGLEVTHITPFEVSFIYTQGTRRTSFTLTPNGRRLITETISP